MRDYLKSWTEFRKANATIDLAKAWSKGGFLFRYGGLWGLFRRNDIALWHYYQNHVQVSVSTNSGIVSIRVLGPTSSFASRLGQRVLNDAVAHIDAMNRQEEADYIATAVARRKSVNARLGRDEGALASYRSRIGIYDPKALYVSQLSYLNDLKEEKAKLKAQYDTLTSATPNNPVGGNMRSAISVISAKITSAKASVSKLSRDAAGYAPLMTAQANDESMLSQVEVAVQEAELNADKNKYYLDIISPMSNPVTAELPHGVTDTLYIFLLSFIFWIFVR